MPLKGKSIVHEINRVFGDNTILVKENGGQDLWAYFWPYYQVLDPGCCVPPAEQTAMGYGIVGAMAAKLARPDRQVVCTTGDGAFQMQLHELGTAVQEGLAVTWVVLDDSAFGWVQWIQKRTEGPIVATQFAPGTDLARAPGRPASRPSASRRRPASVPRWKRPDRRTRRGDPSSSSFPSTRRIITPSSTASTASSRRWIRRPPDQG